MPSGLVFCLWCDSTPPKPPVTIFAILSCICDPRILYRVESDPNNAEKLISNAAEVDAEWRKGQAMILEQAVEYVLEDEAWLPRGAAI